MQTKRSSAVLIILCLCNSHGQQQHIPPNCLPQDVCQRRCNGSVLTLATGLGDTFQRLRNTANRDESSQTLSFGNTGSGDESSPRFWDLVTEQRNRERALEVERQNALRDLVAERNRLRGTRSGRSARSISRMPRCDNLLYRKVLDLLMPSSVPRRNRCDYNEGNITCIFPRRTCHKGSSRAPVDAALKLQLEIERGYNYTYNITATRNQRTLVLGTESAGEENSECLVKVLCQSFYTLESEFDVTPNGANYTFYFNVSFTCLLGNASCVVLPRVTDVDLHVFYGLADDCTSNSC